MHNKYPMVCYGNFNTQYPKEENVRRFSQTPYKVFNNSFMTFRQCHVIVEVKSITNWQEIYFIVIITCSSIIFDMCVHVNESHVIQYYCRYLTMLTHISHTIR